MKLFWILKNYRSMTVYLNTCFTRILSWINIIVKLFFKFAMFSDHI